MPKIKSLQQRLLLVTLTVLLQACASRLPPSSPPAVAPPRIPALSPEARQPPTPSICSPTCSASLTIEREAWRRKLIDGASPGLPASGPTIR
jgi:hypothetical protein